MERKEVQRRKDEIRTRKELLEEKRKKHQQIENDIVEQVVITYKNIRKKLHAIKGSLNTFTIITTIDLLIYRGRL